MKYYDHAVVAPRFSKPWLTYFDHAVVSIMIPEGSKYVSHIIGVKCTTPAGVALFF